MRQGRYGTSSASLAPRLATALLLIAWGSLTAPPWSAPGPVSAAPATFDPVSSTSLGPNSAFGRVVASGDGVFHAVSRSELLDSQFIEYRRSVDGGRTWALTQRFQGSNGGGTDPWIAAHGDDVAIGYVGLWCDSEPVRLCHEAPYLTTSITHGQTWTPPVRLGRQAFEIRVAVDRGRVWAAWESTGTVHVRGTYDGGRTFFAARGITGQAPQLVARDGVMALALQGFSNPRGPVLPIVAVADGETLGPFVPVAAEPFNFGSASSGLAAADGRVHVLLRDREVFLQTAPRRFLVASAGTDGVFDDPVVVASTGYSASIAATRGTVAVAIGTRDGLTTLVTSADGGAGFSRPIAVSQTPGGEPIVEIGAAVPAPDRALVRFDWSVPDRYIDEDNDGLPEPANFSGSAGLDGLRVYAGRTMEVHLDGCGTLPALGRTLQAYNWYVDGVFHDAGDCTTTIHVDDGTTVAVRLTVEDDLGVSTSTTQDVTPQDLVVVSVGDSIASGEGSPHVLKSDAGPAVWQDDPCHRSAYAGPALAARRLELSDPRTSVTFIQLSCSGAAIVDTSDIPGVDEPGDDQSTGGLLDIYSGVKPRSGSVRPSQLAQMDELLGNRTVDALMVSIGANDVRFSSVIEACATTPACHTTSARDTFDLRVRELPSRYARLDSMLTAMQIPAHRVMLTEYFDPTTDDRGLANLRCVLNPTALQAMNPLKNTANLVLRLVNHGEIIDDDEARWARTHVMGALNTAGEQAALAHGWIRVGGIAARFAGRGYCATSHDVVRFEESIPDQDDHFGAFHPNRSGQRIYGDALYPPLQQLVAGLTPSTETGAVVGRQSVGDLAVLTATGSTVTSVAVRSTGQAPIPGVVRRVDRVTTGEGAVGMFGPPAVDRNAAVGAWQQLDIGSGFTLQALVTQLGVHPNVGVESVRIVQAPADGTTIVAGRDTVVLATIDSSIDVTVDVTTTVSAIDDLSGDEHMLFLPVTEPVELHAGRNVVFLPVDQTFRPDDGSKVVATVTVTDPIGATADDEIDNTGHADGTHAPDARATRPVNVAYGRLDLGARTVGCPTVGTLANQQVSFAGAAMPVPDADVGASLFCQPIPTHAQSESGIIELLVDLDEQARYAALDAVVAVVPAGWLSAAAGGAVGVSSAGIRGIVIEAGTPPQTLAHELTHSFGRAGHTDGPIPAFGARVDVAELREGIDWMFWKTPDQVWTGGETWDASFGLIGGPFDAPAPLVIDGNGEWVRGTIELPPGQPPRLSGQAFLQDTGAPSIDRDLEDLQLERLTATQLDASGAPLGPPEPIALAPTGGLYGADVVEQPVTTGWTFAQRIVVDPATAAIRLDLDGVALANRPLTAAPVVAVTAPIATTVVGRGQSMTVDWTIDDPDSPGHTTSVLVSDDAGATWRPLVSGVTGTTATLPLPADIGGTNVTVRVVVSDGARVGIADSETFSAEPAATGVDRLAFVDDISPGRRLMTMNPDGTDTQEISIPVGTEWCATCIPEVIGPEWSLDGSRIYFFSDLLHAGFPIRDTDTGARDGFNFGYMWSVLPDGADLRRETQPLWDSAFWNADTTERFASGRCLTFSVDGQRLAWLGSNEDYIYIADRLGDGWTNARLITRTGADRHLYSGSILNATWPAPTNGLVEMRPFDSCPTFSPDGTELAVRVVMAYWTTGPDGLPMQITGDTTPDAPAVAIFPIDGTGPRIVSPSGGIAFDDNYGRYRPVNKVSDSFWAADGSIIATTLKIVPDGFGERRTHQLNRLDRAAGTLTPFAEPLPFQQSDIPPAKQGPHGVIYGSRPSSSDSRLCGWWILDPITGIADLFSGATSSNSGCWREFDWATVGGVAAPPRLTLDPASAPPDPNAPRPFVEPTGATMPSDVAAPGADDPVGARPIAVANTITIPAGTSTVVQLPTSDGTLAPLEIVELPPADQVVVDVYDPRPLAPRTGIEGTAILTPVAGFTGTVTLSYAVVGSGTPATTTINVVGASPPLAVDDRLTLPPAVESVLDPSVLLANDTRGAGAPVGFVAATTLPDLEVVSVFGATSGRAWLDIDSMLHVLPAAGTSSFTYVIADETGLTSSASVVVLAAAAPTSDPTTTTTHVPTTTTTSIGTTASTTTSVATTSGSTTSTPAGAAGTTTTTTVLVPLAVGASTTTTSPRLSGVLPSTGRSIEVTIMLAAVLVGVGWLLRSRSDRRQAR